MSASFDRLIVGTVVTADDVIHDGYVAIRDETIAAIGEGRLPTAAETADHSGQLIFPGLVDGHMHTSSFTGWSGIESATRCAAAGGVTTCCDMPYDVPAPVTDAAILADKIERMNATSHVDMALYGTIMKTGGVHAIPGLAAAGVSAFKLSTYEYDAVRFPRIDHPTMLAAFHEIAKTGLPCAIHNEDQELVETLTAEARAAGRTEPIMHCRTRPALAETMADLEIFEMALETGAHVHIAHSSLSRGFAIAETFRGMGAQTTAEACIQYLCLTEDDIVRLGGIAKCNPPLRSAAEVERVWECLLQNKIAYISTDHAPWPLERKTLPDIFACSAGLTGMQTFAPLMFSLLEERGLPPTLMATYCAERSAKLHGLWPKKGAIRVGSDADLCVVDPGDFTFDQASILDRADMRWSPYHGRQMRGRVAATYLRGRLIWDGERLLATPGSGRFVPRQSSAVSTA